MEAMNKKTFTLALLFFCATLVWLGFIIYWDIVDRVSIYNTFVALLFVVFSGAMVWNEWHKKRRRHIEEVNRNQIP